MKNMSLILLSSILVMSNTCTDKDDCHHYISFKNKSDKAVYVEYVGGYPDTTHFKYEPNPAVSPELNKVVPGETNTNALWSRSCWEDSFKSLFKSDTVMIFVFDAQILETVPWDTVKVNYLVLKRYDLTLADIQKMNWTITYP